MTRASLASLACVLAASGCAQMGTVQTDNSTTTRYQLDNAGRTNAVVIDVRETKTRASGRALISASSTFEGLNASQDGKNQGLKVDKASQKSDVDKILDVFGKLAPIAASLSGVPTAAAAAPNMTAPPPGLKWAIGPGGIPTLVPRDDASSPVLEEPVSSAGSQSTLAPGRR